MTKDDSHQDELADHISDGGGCCGAWEATSKIRDSVSSETKRRSFLKGIGGIAASAGVLGAAVDPITAAETGPFASISRKELEAVETENEVAKAVSNIHTEAIIDEIDNGKERVDPKNGRAFRVTDSSGENPPITEVKIPVKGKKKPLGFAYSEESTAAGIELEEGLIAKSTNEGENSKEAMVIHRRIAKNKEKKNILKLVRKDEEYKEWRRKLSKDYKVQENKAQISIHVERNRGTVFVPVSTKNGNHPDDASDKAIVASVNLSENKVIEVRDGYWDCMMVCAAMSSSFWGICWSVSCKFCYVDPTKVTCVPCFGCLGGVGLKCTLECV